MCDSCAETFAAFVASLDPAEVERERMTPPAPSEHFGSPQSRRQHAEHAARAAVFWQQAELVAAIRAERQRVDEGFVEAIREARRLGRPYPRTPIAETLAHHRAESLAGGRAA